MAKDEIAYIDSKLDRIDTLLKVIGIELDDEEDDDRLDNIVRILRVR